MPAIVIIWQRFGPYHLARLRGAAEELGQSVRIIGIEIAGKDHYAWQNASDDSVERRTLFSDRQYERLSPSTINLAVTKALDEIGPCAVAINGWNVPEARAALKWCLRNHCSRILMSETHEPSGNIFKEWLKARRVRKFQSALVGGTWHADYLTRLGMARDQILVGYDSIDNDYFATGAHAARERDAEARRELGLPSRFFLANSRFIPRKNIDGLLRAFAQYRMKATNAGPHLEPWSLVLCGDGDSANVWKQLAQHLDIADKVYWPGFVQYSELPQYYGLASVFVHPATAEPWGLVVNEAAACGLPLILGRRVGAGCELLREQENGWSVNATNTDDLSRALNEAWRMSDDQRRVFGNRSQSLVARFHPLAFGRVLLQAVSLAWKDQ